MSETLNINHDQTVDGGRYWALAPGGEASLTYRIRKDGVMVIDHTFTPPEARGGKVALQLVERAVADARANGAKIVPQCAFVDAMFKRHAELGAMRA